MSSANVLPTAPLEEGMHYTRLYPELDVQTQLPSTNADPNSFQLTEISKIEKQIAEEEEQYRVVLKKYKKDRKVVHYFTVGLGGASVVLSSSCLACALTRVGFVVGAPLGAVGVFSGGAATALATFNKKLEKKVERHTKVHALAVAQPDSIKGYVSIEIDDNKVSDGEFQTVLREIEHYRRSKAGLRLKFRPNIPAPPQPSQPDIDKIQIRLEIREEFRKKNNGIRSSNSRCLKIILSAEKW